MNNQELLNEIFAEAEYADDARDFIQYVLERKKEYGKNTVCLGDNCGILTTKDYCAICAKDINK